MSSATSFIVRSFSEISFIRLITEVFYTKHHLKFGKNQADNLEYIGFWRRFFPVFDTKHHLKAG